MKLYREKEIMIYTRYGRKHSHIQPGRQAGAPSLSTQFRATITIIQSPLSPTGRLTHQHSEKALASNAATNSRCNRNTINYHPKTTATTMKATALTAASSLDSGSKGFWYRPTVRLHEKSS